MATTSTESPWQQQAIDQLGQQYLEIDAPDATHAAIVISSDGTVTVLGRTESELAAIVLAEDRLSTDPELGRGEVRVVKLDDLYRWHRAQNAGDELPDVEAATIEPRRRNVETEQPDEVDVNEPEDEEPGDDGEPEPTPQSLDANAAAGKQLFDPSAYDREDLQIPKVDGQTIDRIAIKFGGEIHLDRSDPSDVELYNKLRFGKDVELLIEGRCNVTGAKGATDREGDLDVVVGQKSIKVHSLRKPAGADWVTEA